MDHVMKIMSPTLGDETVTWDPADEKSVKKAKAKFDKAVKKGHLAYKVLKETVSKKGEQIKEFDPSLSEIILSAPLSGG